jgi:hypothetical protein
MRSCRVVWVLGAVASLALGMAAEACGGTVAASGDAATPARDGGKSSSRHETTGASTSSYNATASRTVATTRPTIVTTATAIATTGPTIVTTGATATGTGIGTGTGSCFKVSTRVYPPSDAGMFCPFSAVADGGKDVFCASGQHCCEPPANVNAASVCEPLATTCVHKGSTDWQCQGTADCAAGQVCCGNGVVDQEAAQPGCAPGGGTLPASVFVVGFWEALCQASCASMDAGPAWQLCDLQSDCPPAYACSPVRLQENDVGACMPGSGG